MQRKQNLPRRKVDPVEEEDEEEEAEEGVGQEEAAPHHTQDKSVKQEEEKHLEVKETENEIPTGREISTKEKEIVKEINKGCFYPEAMEVMCIKMTLVYIQVLISTAVARRIEKGQACMERDRIISAEEGTLYNPVHSRGLLIPTKEENMQMVLRDTQRKFRKLLRVSQVIYYNNH